jgi:hypothetical protein
MNDNCSNQRWRAEIEYRSDAGVVDVEHFFNEIEDLHSLIEHGPNWACLIKCTITLNLQLTGLENLTVEQARML